MTSKGQAGTEEWTTFRTTLGAAEFTVCQGRFGIGAVVQDVRGATESSSTALVPRQGDVVLSVNDRRVLGLPFDDVRALLECVQRRLRGRTTS